MSRCCGNRAESMVVLYITISSRAKASAPAMRHRHLRHLTLACDSSEHYFIFITPCGHLIVKPFELVVLDTPLPYLFDHPL